MALDLYTELPPLPALRTIVACSWRRLSVPSADAALEAAVVPDACMDILWRVDGTLSVAGPDTAPYRLHYTHTNEWVGVRFEPGAAPALLGVAASELRDQRVDLADIWGKSAVDQVVDRLLTSPDPAEVVLQQALEERLRNSPPPDPLIQGLVRALQSARSGLATVAADLGMSERHLRRRCEIAIGYGPKTLDRVLRFQRFRQLAERRRASLAQLAAESGYADQAHLTREYRRLAGTTPGRA